MATIILYNGTIHTLDPALPSARAIAVRDGRVLAVGSEGKVQAAASGRAVEGINLKGRTVIPALTDAHIHLGWYALGRREVRLDGIDNLDTAVLHVAEAAKHLPDGAWLLGRGWDHSLWGGRWPRASDIDPLVSDRPVLLMRKDGHSAWVNSRALELAGVSESTPDPAGGSIRRERGQPTGVLLESAIDIVRQYITPATEEARLAAIREAITELHSFGIGAVHIPSALNPGDAAQSLRDVQLLRGRGQLALRCLVHLGLDRLEEAIALGLRSGLGDEWVRLGGVKMFADGSLGSQTAEMLSPYEKTEQTGIATLTDEELRHAVSRANSNGLSVIVHAIGDGANRRVLDAIAAANNQQSAVSSRQLVSDAGRPTANWKLPTIPDRIEHAQLLHPKDIARFAQLGVIASMQPIHATADIEVADALWGSRCTTAYAWKALQEAGATLAFGSDAPVESANPWWGIHAAVTRQRRNGTPAGGWYREQAVSLTDALRAYTCGAAVAAGAAHELGTLAPGMLADMTVLPHDPFKLKPHELHTLHADMLLLAGQVVWEREGT